MTGQSGADLVFTTDPTVDASNLLPRPPERYEVRRWPKGTTAVRHLRDDGTAGLWLVTYPDGSTRETAEIPDGVPL